METEIAGVQIEVYDENDVLASNYMLNYSHEESENLEEKANKENVESINDENDQSPRIETKNGTNNNSNIGDSVVIKIEGEEPVTRTSGRKRCAKKFFDEESWDMADADRREPEDCDADDPIIEFNIEEISVSEGEKFEDDEGIPVVLGAPKVVSPKSEVVSEAMTFNIDFSKLDRLWESRPQEVLGFNVYNCPVDTCDRQLQSVPSMHRHLRNAHRLSQSLEPVTSAPLTCCFCDKEFFEKSRLDLHLQRHSEERPFSCDECNSNFKNKNSLKQHILNIHEGCRRKETPNTTPCDYCGKIFMSGRYREFHMEQLCKSRPRLDTDLIYKCLHCADFKTSYWKKFKDHLPVHSDKDVQCPKCDEKMGIESLPKHLSQAHSLSLFLKPLKWNTPRTGATKMIRKITEAANQLEANEDEEPSIAKDTDDEQDSSEGPANKAISKASLDSMDCKGFSITTTEDGETRYVCNLCEKSLKVSIIQHLRSRHGVDQNLDPITEKPEHVCIICNKWFFDVHRLNAHMKIHTDDRPFKCPTCLKYFKTERILIMHQRHMHEGVPKKVAVSKKSPCPHCGKTVQASHLPYHIARSCNSAPEDKKAERVSLKCEHCDFTTPHPTNLRMHESLHDKKPHTCTVCGENKKSVYSLNAHMLQVHSLTPKNHRQSKSGVICPICNKYFNGTSKLELHMVRHRGEKAFQCDICNKFFATEGSRNVHKKHMHFGVPKKPATNCRLVNCPHCNRSVQIKHLKYHIRRSCPEAPEDKKLAEDILECEVCSFRTKHPNTMRGHRTLHAAPEESSCELCGQRQKSIYSLELHMRKEHGVTRRHRRAKSSNHCPVCNKYFAGPFKLNLHMNLHRNVRPFKCKLCDKAFSAPSTLNKHVRGVHYREYRYQCSRCGAATNNATRLNTHRCAGAPPRGAGPAPAGATGEQQLYLVEHDGELSSDEPHRLVIEEGGQIVIGQNQQLVVVEDFIGEAEEVVEGADGKAEEVHVVQNIDGLTVQMVDGAVLAGVDESAVKAGDNGTVGVVIKEEEVGVDPEVDGVIHMSSDLQEFGGVVEEVILSENVEPMSA